MNSMSIFHLLATFLLIGFALANTEKTIFLGPESLPVPEAHPTLSDLALDVLTPQNSTLRTNLRAAFPTPEALNGVDAWYLLDDLTEGQRYEVRVCWAATQPTAFTLQTYQLNTVFSTPELITSLASYAAARRFSSDEDGSPSIHTSSPSPEASKDSSILFLQIQAAADYYTSNEALMKNENVPPVPVDIILDPFVANILPRSLVPTVIYVCIAAVVAWFVSDAIVGWLRKTARGEESEKKNQ